MASYLLKPITETRLKQIGRIEVNVHSKNDVLTTRIYKSSEYTPEYPLYYLETISLKKGIVNGVVVRLKEALKYVNDSINDKHPGIEVMAFKKGEPGPYTKIHVKHINAYRG